LIDKHLLHIVKAPVAYSVRVNQVVKKCKSEVNKLVKRSRCVFLEEW